MSQHLPPLAAEDQALLAGATMIGLVGGPGSGKGTQCSLLVQDPELESTTAHISIGDIMRREADAGGEHSAAIRQWHAEGVLGDVNVTMAVLRRVLLEHVKEKGTSVFLLDGFPRATDRLAMFEQHIAHMACLLVLRVPDEIMMDRLAKASRGRADDMSLESIKARIDTFHQRTQLVISHFSHIMGTVIFLDGDMEVEEVFHHMKHWVKNIIYDVAHSEDSRYLASRDIAVHCRRRAAALEMGQREERN
ncbi:hypothetical protein RB601_003264 [Gaeumannomyces tritici]